CELIKFKTLVKLGDVENVFYKNGGGSF
ncbi:hypothetical protein MNBD_BACTEROID02-1139, partial [hydrothermal vent metagenome]